MIPPNVVEEVEVHILVTRLKLTDYQSHVLTDILLALKEKWNVADSDWFQELEFYGTFPLKK